MEASPRGAGESGGVTVSDGTDSEEVLDGVSGWHRLTVTCDDRGGLLADLSEHLRAHGVDVVSAAVATDTESGQIVDSFAVRARAARRPRRGRRCGGAPPRVRE